MKRHITYAIIGFLVVAPYTAHAVELSSDIEDILRTTVFQWINQSRRTEELPLLRYSHQIASVAADHAIDTTVHFDPTSLESREKTYLAHVSSDGKTLEQRFESKNVPSGWGYAENAGYWIRDPFGGIAESSAYGLKLIHEGMMAEVPPNDSHRENILGPYSHVGIGLSLLQAPEESLNAIFLVANFSRYGTEEDERSFREAFGHIPTSPRSIKNPDSIPAHGGTFIDVRPNHPFARAIERMKLGNILSGYDDGTFQPERTVSRAELVKMILVALGISPIGREFNACFSDVFNQWFAPYVCLARRGGWLTGYDDGSFRPSQDISRAEGITLIARAFGLRRSAGIDAEPFIDVPPGAWFEDSIYTMREHHVLPFAGNALSPNRGLTRGEVAEILDRTIEGGFIASRPNEGDSSHIPRNLHEKMHDESSTMIHE